jgi:hypothetical protein
MIIEAFRETTASEADRNTANENAHAMYLEEIEQSSKILYYQNRTQVLRKIVVDNSNP